LVAVSTTMAWLSAVVPDWVIEQDWVMPVVLMQVALFVARDDVETWTTAQRPLEHWKTLRPAAEAICTTG